MGRGARNGLLCAMAALVLGAGASAAWAAPTSPTAIGVDGSGNSYVGDAAGTIRKFDVDGNVKATFSEGAGIIALKVDSGGNLWVLDLLNRVQQLSPTGAVLRTRALPFCNKGSAPFAPGQGGIDVDSAHVWVASPCSDKLFRFTLDLASSFTITVASPHGVAVQGNEVSVGRWNNLDVVVLDATTGDQKRVRSIGFQPADIFVDQYDVLFASDVGSDTISMFGSDGVKFRTLGRSGANAGDLNDPYAFDIGAQNIGSASGNIFIADTGNQRVQRWNSYGYTFWVKSNDGGATGGGGGGTPTTTTPTTTTPTTTTPTTTTPTTTTPTTTTPGGGGGGGGGTPSSFVGVTINDAAVFVSSPNVTLKISAPASATGVLISNDGGFGGSTAKPIASDGRYAWTLQSSGAERLPKTVYVRFTGTPDTNLTFTDDVILDQAPPKVTSASVAGASTRARPLVTLRVKAKDSLSGVAQLQVANKPGPNGAFTPYRTKVRVAVDSAKNSIYVRAVDHAGNFGHWVKAKR